MFQLGCSRNLRVVAFVLKIKDVRKVGKLNWILKILENTRKVQFLVSVHGERGVLYLKYVGV